MGRFPVYRPISLVFMQLQTKEAFLPSGSTIITAIGKTIPQPRITCVLLFFFFNVQDLSSGSCNLSSNSVVQITGEGGSFSSPGYPYPFRGTCGWNITVPSGKLVKLTFLDFDGYCNRNYAEVFDEPNSVSEV